MEDSYKEAFHKGTRYYKCNNYIEARKYYNISLKDCRFKDISLNRLILIDIKEGKFLNARQMLDEVDKSNLRFNHLFGLLESAENNFIRSREYYKKSMDDSDLKNISLLALTKIHIQFGEYDEAENILEILSQNPNFAFQSIVNLISISILKREYTKAMYYFDMIDSSNLTFKLMQHYKLMYLYIKYFLGEIDSLLGYSKNYTYGRLINDNASENLLLKHIGIHSNPKLRYSYGCFFPDIDLKCILSEAKERIKEMNANHFEMSDLYKISLDKPIGYKGDIVTNEICVTTLISTKDILTIFPISLSHEFDCEGFSLSKEIKNKRMA